MNIKSEWESKYKPMILESKKVKLELVAEILGYRTREPIEEMLRSNLFSFGVAVKHESGTYTYAIHPLRFIAWYEGKMS